MKFPRRKVLCTYCLICKCYPGGATGADDPTSTDRTSLTAREACAVGGGVGGSGPRYPEPPPAPGVGTTAVVPSDSAKRFSAVSFLRAFSRRCTIECCFVPN